MCIPEKDTHPGGNEDTIMIVAFISFYLVTLCAALYLMITLPRSTFFKHFENKFKARMGDEKPPWGVKQYLDKDLQIGCCHPGIIIFSSFFLSYMTFPFLAAAYAGTTESDGESSLILENENGVELAAQGWPFDNLALQDWWWSPIVLGCFNLSDFLGRNMPIVSAKFQFSVPQARAAVSARIVLVVVMVICVSPQVQVIKSSIVFLVFLCFLGFSNGWIVTSCMMIGSDYCPDSMAGRASGVLVDHKSTSKFEKQ